WRTSRGGFRASCTPPPPARGKDASPLPPGEKALATKSTKRHEKERRGSMAVAARTAGPEGPAYTPKPPEGGWAGGAAPFFSPDQRAWVFRPVVYGGPGGGRGSPSSPALALFAFLCLFVLFVANPASRGADPTYWQDVRPILRKSCTVCHNPRNLKEVELSG